MASPVQFVSLDGTTLEGETVDFRASENALARRSISIFSRRGTEDHPEPTRPFIAQAATRTPREMSERQKNWLKRSSLPVQSSSPQKTRGTVLNAVPAAKTIQMTSLEEEMATSPNDEIMTAIDSPSTPRLASASPSSPPSAGLWAKRDGSPKSSRSCKRKVSNTRIGVWMNGIAHWDENARPERSVGIEEPSLPETRFTPQEPTPAERQLGTPRTCRPQLSVVIPGRKPVTNDTTISTIVASSEMPPRSLASVAPAKRISKFLSPQPMNLGEAHVVSPLEAVPLKTTPQIVVENENGSKKEVSRSSSSESSLVEHDDLSSYSRRSSATSIETPPPREREPKLDFREQTGSKAFSIISPAAAGVFGKVIFGVANVDKPLPPCPGEVETPEPSLKEPSLKEPPSPQSAPGTFTIVAADPIFSTRHSNGLAHASSTRSEPALRVSGPKQDWRTIELEPIVVESARTSSYLLSASAPGSPTLSQAEHALEAQLSLIEQHVEKSASPEIRVSFHRGNSVHSVMHPPERAPTLPRRSRKREWRRSPNFQVTVVEQAKAKDPRRRRSETELRRSSEFTHDDAASKRPLRKTCSSFELYRLGELTTQPPTKIQELSTLPQVAYEDGLIVLEGPVTLQKVMDDAVLTVSSAENTLLHILESLPSTIDLFNTALINKGMYRVYLENEMHLIRTVTRNQSSAAAELREWSPSEIDDAEPRSAGSSHQLEHTPLTFMRGHRRDLAVIQRLKALVLERCQTFIRRETAFALYSSTHPESKRFDDAFFRIWCFCKIFGSNKGREEDVAGQLDWLKGGLLANSSDLSATMNMNLDFEMGSVLLNPPDHFAKGNEGGLTAQQLYDMTEVWGCLTYLLQPYQGQTRQARRCGVFGECEIFDGDEEREEYLLEEWTAHLLTLGPAVVLEMAELAHEDSSYGFAFAKSQGWTDWRPPQYSGSRTTFLKEPVSRLYEERVSAAAMTLRNPAEREKKEMTRKRMATLAAEIRLARQSSTYKRLPMIDQANERAMSVLSRQGSTASNFSYRATSPVLTRSTSVSQKRMSKAPNFSTPRPLEPKTLVHSQHRRKISPIIEDKVETFNRMSAVHSAMGVHSVVPDTTEVAIKRITEMGFTRREAQQALRETDRGDGLRLDRAVEMLLKSM